MLSSVYCLGEPLLKDEVETLGNSLKQKTEKAEGVGMPVDGWKNVAKKALMNFCIIYEQTHVYDTYDVSAKKKTGQNLYELVREWIIVLGREWGVRFLFYCSDGGPAEALCGRILLAWRRDMVVVHCSSHTWQLILGNLLTFNGKQFLKLLASFRPARTPARSAHNSALDLAGRLRRRVPQQQESLEDACYSQGG